MTVTSAKTTMVMITMIVAIMTYTYSTDILCVRVFICMPCKQETHLNFNNRCFIGGYEIYRKGRQDRPKGGDLHFSQKQASISISPSLKYTKHFFVSISVLPRFPRIRIFLHISAYSLRFLQIPPVILRFMQISSDLFE